MPSCSDYQVSSGDLGVAFDEPPAALATVKIRWYPAVDTFKIRTQINQPTFGEETNRTAPVRLLGQALGFTRH